MIHQSIGLKSYIYIGVRNSRAKTRIPALMTLAAKTANTRAKVKVTASKLSFFPNDQQKIETIKFGHPHISIIMELGIVPKIQPKKLEVEKSLLERPSRKFGTHTMAHMRMGVSQWYMMQKDYYLLSPASDSLRSKRVD